MFNQLLESRAHKQKMAGGTMFSIVLHTVLIGGAVYATARAGVKDEKAKAEKIQFVEMKKEPPKEAPKEPPPKEVVVKPPPPKGFQVLRAPVKIDIKIPEIDLSKAVTNESDFTGKGVKGGTGSGVVGGTGPVTNQTYFEFQVEKQVAVIAGNAPPRYPEALRQAGVEGRVMAEFVVNEQGRTEEASIRFVQSDNDLFEDAVRVALRRMRFIPAEVGGRKVRQLVEMPFVFTLAR